METKTPRVKIKEIRIKEIQEAAKHLFFDRGVANVSIQEVAKLAGVSVGTVYLYFRNKDDLYISLMLPFVKKIQESLLKIDKDMQRGKYKTGPEFMRALLNAYYRLYKWDPDAFKIIEVFLMGNVFPQTSRFTKKQLNEIARVNFSTARRMISEAKARGLIQNGVNEAALADVIFATWHGIMILEESKLRGVGKDHLFSTLDYAFSLFSNAICPK